MSVFDKTSFKRYTLNVINKVGGFYPWLKKSALACTACGSRNYSKAVSDSQRTERLEVKNSVSIVKAYTS